MSDLRELAEWLEAQRDYARLSDAALGWETVHTERLTRWLTALRVVVRQDEQEKA